MQEQRDHVCRDQLFVVLCHSEGACSEAGVGDEGVEAGERLCTLAEGNDRFIRAQVELPDLDGVGGAGRSFLNVLCCRFSFVDVAAREDDFRGAELDEPADSFFAQANIAACDDDGFAGKGGGGDGGRVDELPVEEF